jgi:hypothetical protein
MGLFPEVAVQPNAGFVSSVGAESVIGMGFAHLVTAAVVTQNMVYLMPVRLEQPATFVGMGWHNGATVNGQCAAAIYTLGGTRLDYTAHTGQSGASTAQYANLTNANVSLSPGVYYIAFGSDSATATFWSASVEVNTARVAGGISQVGSAYANPLPATITPAWPLTSARAPMVWATMTTAQ